MYKHKLSIQQFKKHVVLINKRTVCEFYYDVFSEKANRNF